MVAMYTDKWVHLDKRICYIAPYYKVHSAIDQPTQGDTDIMYIFQVQLSTRWHNALYIRREWTLE